MKPTMNLKQTVANLKKNADEFPEDEPPELNAFETAVMLIHDNIRPWVETLLDNNADRPVFHDIDYGKLKRAVRTVIANLVRDNALEASFEDLYNRLGPEQW
jgi:hypothetical protein